MSNYYVGVRSIREEAMRERCASRLRIMRAHLAELRTRNGDDRLMLATWNIRDFGAVGRFGSTGRLPESLFYIAEILSTFDLVAVQEVNENLHEFDQVMSILGRGWDYLLTDTTAGRGGNGERMAFVYRRDKVTFERIAGEIVLPEGQTVVPQAVVEPPDRHPESVGPSGAAAPAAGSGQQFARTPFLVAFQSSWFKFNLCTVHIYYGESSGAGLQRRIGEIRQLVKFFVRRQDDENRTVHDKRRATNYILLGDFNVVSPQHETGKALASGGFTIPAPIDGERIPDRDHFYDQIAVRVQHPDFRVVDGGIVDIYQDVFTDADLPIYQPLLPADGGPSGETPEEAYADWRTWQLSDHSPLWVTIRTDFADEFLEEIARHV